MVAYSYLELSKWEAFIKKPLFGKQRHRHNMLVAMKGHPGCGKSTIARLLGKSLKWPVVDKDDIRDSTQAVEDALLNMDSNNGSSDSASDAKVAMAKSLLNSMSYEAMWRCAETQAELGLSFIVDCPMSRPELMDRAAAIATRRSMRLVVIECVAATCPDTWKARISSRNEAWHKPSRWEDLQALLKSYAGCHDYDLLQISSSAKKLVIDTTSEYVASRPCEEILPEFLQWLHSVSDVTPAVTFFPSSLR